MVGGSVKKIVICASDKGKKKVMGGGGVQEQTGERSERTLGSFLTKRLFRYTLLQSVRIDRSLILSLVTH